MLLNKIALIVICGMDFNMRRRGQALWRRKKLLRGVSTFHTIVSGVKSQCF